MAQSIRDEEQRNIRRRRGLTGTMLTSPLGTTGDVERGGTGGMLGGV